MAVTGIQQYPPWLKFTAIALLLSMVGACDSGSSMPAPEVVVVDDASIIEDAQSGTLEVEDQITRLVFSVNEDEALDGVLASTPDQNEPSTSDNGISAVSTEQITIQSLPASGTLALIEDSAVFQYEPEPDFFGTDRFVYSLEGSEDIEVVINVEPVPDAPVLNSVTAINAEQGRPFSLLLEALDADGDEVSFSGSNLPEWLTLDGQTGLLSGIPEPSDIGTFAMVSISAHDGTGLSDVIDEIDVSVVDINDAPQLNITQVPHTLYGREVVSFRVFPDDLDDDSVSVSVERSPYFDSTVTNDLIELRVKNLNEAVSEQLTIVARDELGAVTREEVPIKIFPRTRSGNGITVSGFREGRGVHVVILGDGYASDQQRAFREHVNDLLLNISLDEGIADHLGAFNFHLIDTVSRQTGSDDGDDKDTVDTAFDSNYNCNSVPRLVCADILKMFEVAVAEYPSVDQLILLVNDRRFGGSGNSGGRVAITSGYFPEIALHEMGHSLADLADEYVDPLILENPGIPPFVEGRFKNVSTLNDPAQVPWAHWIDESVLQTAPTASQEVGVFAGGLYRSTGVFRATADSRMRSFAQPFGPVNSEQWILRLYTLTEGIRSISPMEETLRMNAGEFQGFSVDPVFGFDVQSVSWTLNGEPLEPSGVSTSFGAAGVPGNTFAETEDSSSAAIELTNSALGQALATETLSRLALSLPAGNYQLVLRVSDNSGRIQVQPPHAGIFTWSWQLNVL